jgi:hypothetical protein
VFYGEGGAVSDSSWQTSELEVAARAARPLRVVRVDSERLVECCGLCWIGPTALAGYVVVDDGARRINACGRCLVAVETLFLQLGTSLLFVGPRA